MAFAKRYGKFFRKGSKSWKSNFDSTQGFTALQPAYNKCFVGEFEHKLIKTTDLTFPAPRSVLLRCRWAGGQRDKIWVEWEG